MTDSDTSVPQRGLREEYLALLEAREREQVYQSFLERHSRLIPREFVQNHGLHFGTVLRKLRFGAEYACDFFYMSKSSDDWNLVFVEIEKPGSRFFRDNSNALHPDFQAGLQQINRWRAWLSSLENLAAFMATTVAPLHLPLVMRRNPVHPKFVLVHGRRGEYGDNDLRRAIVAAEEREDFKILSFDSLAEGLAYKHDCFIGVKRNETVELRGDTVVVPEIFGWIDPTQFVVTPALRDAIRAQVALGPTQLRHDGTAFTDAYAFVADRIRTRSNAGIEDDTLEASSPGQSDCLA